MRALRSIGISVTRCKPEKFGRLRYAPRYQEMTLDLCGKPFVVSDARSFFFSYQEIFQDEIYRFASRGPAPRIVDCGANYGLSVAYFKQTYPAARIVAVEADPDIFRLLERNINSLGLDNVELHQRAVWPEPGTIDFQQEGADAGRVRPTASSDNGSGPTPRVARVDTIPLDELINEPTDLLKMDIEGAEVPCLTRCSRLQNVQQLFVEYHSFPDQPQRLDELLRAMAEEGFRYSIHTQHASPQPLVATQLHAGMDLQLNIFGTRP